MGLVWAMILGSVGAYGSGGEPAARWVQIGQRMEEAHSAEEFRQFQKRFPQYFGEEDSAHVSYAFVQTERYAFRGATRCAPDDPRLIHEVITHGACLGEQAEGQCFQAMAEGLPEGDPCGSQRQ